jgi:imidazolonepropionase-like amidohydrolase
MKTILSHANLIDCVEPKVRPDTAVLIEDGRIRAILSSGEAGSAGDARVIDLKGGYLMPGLWDVHIHPDYLSLDEMPLADQVTLFGHRLAVALTESGIVGLRCAGAHHFMDVAWKRAFDSAQHVGPRLFASGYFLTTTGGHFLTSGHAREVDGPYGWVKAIREQIKNGVDHIKLNLSGGIMGPAWDEHANGDGGEMTEVFVLRGPDDLEEWRAGVDRIPGERRVQLKRGAAASYHRSRARAPQKASGRAAAAGAAGLVRGWSV